MADTAPASASTIPDTGPVTAKEIYQLLLFYGFSTIQAIGIMANMMNESSLNPEAVGDSGTSFGLVQFHTPGYAGAASLVTGNAQADARAQIKYLTTVLSPNAVAGSTAAQVAGNFAANFERCVGCQSGGTQYNSRVANAATVASWVSSGNWPTIDVSAVTGGAAIGAAEAQQSQANVTAASDCLIGFTVPGSGAVSGLGAVLQDAGSALTGGAIPPSANTGPDVICLFSKSEARALIGGLLMVAGAMVMGVGLAVVVLNTTPGKAATHLVRRAGAAATMAAAPEAAPAVAATAAGGRKPAAKKKPKAKYSGWYASEERREASGANKVRPDGDSAS